MPPPFTAMSALRAVSRNLRPARRQSIPSLATRIPRTFPRPQIQRTPTPLSSIRFYSTETNPEPPQRPLTDRGIDPNAERPPKKNPVPEYEMTFTCKPCSTRSTHRVSKQGYHTGSVLITCPECRNKHIISDHLNVFGNKSMTVEDFMREQGQLVKKGTLSEDGGLEFWADGTTTSRENVGGIAEGGEQPPKEVESGETPKAN